jgi:hypothetical protein
MGSKPVLVSWNHADKLLQPVIKLRDFLKCRRATTAPSSTRLIGLVIDRDSQPVVSTVGPILRRVSNLSERPLETIGSRSFFCRSFHRYTLPRRCAVIRSHEDSASLGAVATYGLVSDQSSAFLESESGSFQRESDHTLLRLRRRPGDRTALGAEAAYGLTSDQSTSAIPGIHRLQW